MDRHQGGCFVDALYVCVSTASVCYLILHTNPTKYFFSRDIKGKQLSDKITAMAALVRRWERMDRKRIIS